MTESLASVCVMPGSDSLFWSDGSLITSCRVILFERMPFCMCLTSFLTQAYSAVFWWLLGRKEVDIQLTSVGERVSMYGGPVRVVCRLVSRFLAVVVFRVSASFRFQTSLFRGGPPAGTSASQSVNSTTTRMVPTNQERMMNTSTPKVLGLGVTKLTVERWHILAETRHKPAGV